MFDTKAAPTYICAGDTYATNEGAFTIRARIRFDGHARPTDYQCYTDEDIAAWQRDEWFYCGVVLRVSFNGIDLDTEHVSLWGVEANLNGDNSHVFDVANDMIPGALVEAKARLRDIKGKLALID